MNGKTALGLDNNVGALLCYIPVCGINLIYSIIVLVTDKTNKLPRFHAIQSLLLQAVSIIISIPLYFLTFVMLMMNSTITSLIGGLFGLVFLVFGLAILFFLVMSLVKAFQGQIYKIPVIGGMADKWSS